MNLLCIKCGQGFSVSLEQFGSRGKCPHCQATILIPNFASRSKGRAIGIVAPSLWVERSFAALIALGAHLVVLGIVAMIPWQFYERGTIGSGEEIQIGFLPKQRSLKNELRELQLNAENIQSNRIEFESFSADSVASQSRTDLLRELSSAGGTSGGADAGITVERSSATDIVEIGGGQEGFTELVSRLHKEGLDIAILFDSTGSMGGEINQIKDRISEIGRVLFQLVPKTRISICAYRDTTSDYVVKGLPLTGDLGELVGFLSQFEAAGGGDAPEAVDEGLRWVIENNEFRPTARKVILIFGDQPPHVGNQVDCLKLATDFRRGGGIVSTITCRNTKPLKEFVEIAQLGGGEAFLTNDHRQIMSRLIVLVFGSKHREKVLELFRLLEK
jgi:DNA-directed RNA polymerase subunit RPC12/RpoP